MSNKPEPQDEAGARPPSPDPTGGTRVPARDRGIPGQTSVWAPQYLNAHPNPSYGDLTRFPWT